jgi:hypothetical protein
MAKIETNAIHLPYATTLPAHPSRERRKRRKGTKRTRRTYNGTT